jgi:uncharacterized membrane protein
MPTKTGQVGAAVLLSSDRLASLSDTMFGVAMTLVVTTLLPSIQAHNGALQDMFPAMGGELFTVVLSFTISARYWVSQQQRLAMTRFVAPFQTWLHLAFLFLIVLVPITTSLDGLTGSGAKLSSVLIYGGHLFLIATVNLLLWIEVHRTVGAHLQIVRSSLALTLLAAALAVGAVRPDFAVYFWFAVIGTTPLAPFLTRRLYGV